MDNPNGAGISNGMKYRGLEYSVVQGIERGKWRWSVTLANNIARFGQAISKETAAEEAERTIDKALAIKRLRLVPPGNTSKR
jgi:hypothetical protein